MGFRCAFPTALVLLALLLTTAHAATTYQMKVYCFLNPGVQTDIGTCMSESIAISAIGLVFSLVIVALTYMMGEIINMGNLKGWYRRELWETTKSALLVVVVYSSLVLFGGIGASLAGASQSASSPLLTANPTISCPSSATFSTQASSGLEASLAILYNTAINSYLQPTLCYSYKSFSAIFGLSAGVRTAKSVTVATWIPFPILPFPFPEAIFGSISSGSQVSLFTSGFLEAINVVEPNPFSFLKSVITLIIVPTLIQLQLQSDLLPLVVTTGIGLFLPLGIIFRAVPFLRGIGGTMVAIAIGISLIYPIMLVTFNLPVTDYFAGLITGSSQYSGGGCGVLCSVVNWLPAQSAQIPLRVALRPYDAAAAEAGWVIGFWDYSASLRSIFPALNFVNEYSLIMVLQFVLFPIDILFGVISVQAIAKSLGGKLTLSLGKRVKIA